MNSPDKNNGIDHQPIRLTSGPVTKSDLGEVFQSWCSLTRG